MRGGKDGARTAIQKESKQLLVVVFFLSPPPECVANAQRMRSEGFLLLSCGLVRERVRGDAHERPGAFAHAR